jgi:hypothetical protein
MRTFLIVYDRQSGAVDVREFPPGEGREAIRARFEAEAEHRGEPDIEVVVIGSRSREELLATHSRYFRSARELLKGGAQA